MNNIIVCHEHKVGCEVAAEKKRDQGYKPLNPPAYSSVRDCWFIELEKPKHLQTLKP